LKSKNNVRINELARELEVKAQAILEALPEIGVQEKKTHSSSLEESLAKEIREYFRKKAEQPVDEIEVHLESPADTIASVRSADARAQVSAQPIPSTAPPAAPPILSGGGMPLRPPIQALRPPLRKAAPAAKTVETPSDLVTPPPASVGPAVPGAPVAQPPQARVSTPPAIAPGRRVKPIPSQPAAGAVARGPRAPLAPDLPQARPPAARSGIAAPIRPPVAGGVRETGRAIRAPGSPAQAGPGQPVSRAAPQAGRPVRKPVLVPGQPIYQRPKRPAPALPGMPSRGPGQRPGGRMGHPTTPGAPTLVPGAPAHRPHDPRRPMRGAHGRPVRDREAEREQEFLKRQNFPKVSAAPPQAVNKEVTISPGTTVKELAERLGIKANLVIKALVDRGLFATINQTLDIELLKDLCKYFGATTTETSFEEETMQELELAEAPADKEKRSPVVTVMGHVDHGKTSLLDAIRQSNVAAREAGGITQAIGAYHVTHKDRRIVFIDTPGHEAFTRMRARGAKITDVVILVVAADDGVMPQTLEAIDHAKAAGVPIMVAINKIDVPNAQPDRVKQQLADRGLLPEDWGGDTVMVPVSAKTKENLELLLEMVLLVSDLNELTANPARPAVGTVLEAKLDRGQGPIATVLVQNGTLRLGDYFLVGSVFGKVRAMIDDRGEKISEAPPSTGVVVLGLEGLPQPGDLLQVVSDTDKAKKVGEFREEKAREQNLSKTSRLSLEQFQEQLKAGDIKELPLVLKADVQGSTEVLTDTLQKLSNNKVKVLIVRSGVGAISESDVLLAATANAIIIGFSVRPERSASVLAEREKVDIRLYTVIYELVDEIKRAMAGLLEPILKETFQGRAEVLETFKISKVGAIAGCVIQEGRVARNSEVRLLRDNVVVYTGKVSSLRRFKDEASEVRSGQECGIGLENFNDIKQGDVIEAFVTERVAQEVLV